MKEELSILNAQLSDKKVEIMKRRDQMDSEVQANSKMLVSGNHAAKADHFTKVKKELLKSQENERKLME